MSLNLRQIEVFRAVMSAGTISGASRILNVSQPAVSRLLSYTEIRLGFPLFERIKGRLYATPEAKLLFREVDHVFLGVQRVNEVAHSLAIKRQGILNIVSSPSIGHMLIPLAIARLSAEDPSVRINFQFLHYEQAQDHLLRQKADIGVLSTMIDHPNLESTPIGMSRLVCICPRGHVLAGFERVSAHDLLRHPLIGYPPQTPFGKLVGRFFETAGVPVQPMIEVGSPQSACALVDAGAGVALVDKFSLHNWRGHDLVMRPLHDAPIMTANMAFLRFEPMSQLAKVFAAHLRDLMVENGFGPETLREPSGRLHDAIAENLAQAIHAP